MYSQRSCRERRFRCKLLPAHSISEQLQRGKGTHLVNAGGIHYEPFGIYPGTKSSLDDIADGDTIAVPNDTTNEARALLLLQDNGVITLKDGAGLGSNCERY